MASLKTAYCHVACMQLGARACARARLCTVCGISCAFHMPQTRLRRAKTKAKRVSCLGLSVPGFVECVACCAAWPGQLGGLMTAGLTIRIRWNEVDGLDDTRCSSTGVCASMKSFWGLTYPSWARCPGGSLQSSLQLKPLHRTLRLIERANDGETVSARLE